MTHRSQEYAFGLIRLFGLLSCFFGFALRFLRFFPCLAFFFCRMGKLFGSLFDLTLKFFTLPFGISEPNNEKCGNTSRDQQQAKCYEPPRGPERRRNINFQL